MLEIPYVKSQPMGCALASYTMVAKYFFPDTSEEEIKTMTHAEPGYVVWSFVFWKWIMDKGISIHEFDACNYKLWAEKGIKGLEASVSEKEFDYYQKHTKDLEGLTSEMKLAIKHPNFTFHVEKPTYDTLKQAVDEGAVCEVAVDSRTLNNLEGYSLHRLVILEATDDYVIFHDPQEEPIPNKHIKRKETKEHFINSWLRSSDGGYELCIYRK